MAYAFMRTMVQTRSKGHTATGAMCYRMGIAAESTIPGADGEPRHFDYTRRTGIAATGWAAPPGTDRSWRDPVKWAHRIEAVDKRKNSRQCRDDVVGIPVELVEAGVAEEAVQDYADRLAAEHNTVVHFALHKPDRGGVNHHAHVLYPGRHVEGLTFSRKRDREQDNPTGGGPDLVARHKSIWSEVCRGWGVELDWTSEAPGHHLGPALCAVKRARLVEQTRETIRETVAASTPGEAVPDKRTLQAVAEIATRVNDGLTVTEMLERELDEARHGRPAPRPVPAPAPFRPEVVPTAGAHEVLPPVKRAPEVLPPVRRPEVLPPARHPADVSPPYEVVAGAVAARVEEEHPRESAATWSEVERHIELQRRQTLAHEQAREAARKLGEAARKRERAKPAQPPAPPGRIRRIAEWLLSRARQVLEYFGLEPAAAPGRTPARVEASAPLARQPRLEPTLWERYQARWSDAAGDRALLEDLTEKPLPAALAGNVSISGINVWRRVLRGMFETDDFHRSRTDPKPLPRALAPAGEAGPDAAAHAADYAGSLPARYRLRFDQERIAERSLEAAKQVRQTLRYRRFAGEKRKQTLEDGAIRQACGDDAQRLDREMRAERRQWQRHWDVLVRHDTLLRDEQQEREGQRQSEQLEKTVERFRTPGDRDRGDPGRTM